MPRWPFLSRYAALPYRNAPICLIPLFVRMRKGDKIVRRKDGSLWRLSEQAVFDIARRLAMKCGIAQFSPHDLRRSCISDLLDAGADRGSRSNSDFFSGFAANVRYYV